MRVLHTIRSLDPLAGGPSRSVPLTVDALCKAGVDAYVWSLDGGSSLCRELEIPVVGTTLEAALAGYEWDLVHDHGVWRWTNRRVARLCRSSETCRVVSPRGMLEPWALRNHRWRKQVAWYAYQKSHLLSSSGLHATSQAEADQLRALGFEGPVAVIPNGVESRGTFALASFDRPPQALFMSRLHPKKGLALLIEAWRTVRPSGWTMRVVGPDEGGHRAELERLVAAAGLQGEWSFEAPVYGNDRWRVLQEAQLFILPSHSENFGIVVAEALAAGLPVITTTGTPWNRIDAMGCGLQVAPQVGAIASALEDLTSRSAEERRAMGTRGHSWVEGEFDWAKIGAQLSLFYDELLCS